MGRKYIFTNKKESRKGIMSTVLGAVSLFSLFLAVYGTFQNQGEALVKYGMGVFVRPPFCPDRNCFGYHVQNGRR